MKRSPDRSALELAHAETDGLEAALHRLLAAISAESLQTDAARSALALLAERGQAMPAVAEEAAPMASKCER
jgi:hypothetical protein